MEKGDGKSDKKLKKLPGTGVIPINSEDIAATIDDMDRVMDELQRMPENGKVILFALLQLALAVVRSKEAFGVFRKEYSDLNEMDLVTFVDIVNNLPNNHMYGCFHLHYLPLLHILEAFRVQAG